MSSNTAREIAALREAIRGRLPQFRILIVGASNAQKAKMTRMISGADDNPLVLNPRGERMWEVNAEAGWPRPSNPLKQLSIDHEIRYYQNPGLIFHESKGVGDNDKDELQNILTFIEERSTKAELHERLHAIWYCIPLGIQQPPSSAERQFFKNGNKGIPVILIFVNNQPSRGATLADMNRGPLGLPKGYLRQLLGSAASKEMTVGHNLTLLEATARAINHNMLRDWFISLQWDKMELKYMNCIERIVPRIHNDPSALPGTLHGIVGGILNAFLDTYMYNLIFEEEFREEEFFLQREERERRFRFFREEEELFRAKFDLEVIPLLLSATSELRAGPHPPLIVALATMIVTLIVVGNAVSLHRGMNEYLPGPELTQCIRESSNRYRTQGLVATLREVERVFEKCQTPRDISGGSKDERAVAQLIEKTYEIVLKYRLDKGQDRNEENQGASEAKEVTIEPFRVEQTASATPQGANRQGEMDEQGVVGSWKKFGRLFKR